MNAITMQELSEQSQTLLDIAAILPSTYIEPKGYLSGGEISETSDGWTLRLTLSGLGEMTAKKILMALSELE